MTIINNVQKLKNIRKKLRNAMTVAEIILWSRIKNKQLLGYKFRRQHSVGNYILDFYCPKLKLGIELDGGHHNQPKQLQYDQQRTLYLNSLNIVIVRYWNTDIFNNLDGVFEDLSRYITKSLPS